MVTVNRIKYLSAELIFNEFTNYKARHIYRSQIRDCKSERVGKEGVRTGGINELETKFTLRPKGYL
jgi:hypothetical protein